MKNSCSSCKGSSKRLYFNCCYDCRNAYVNMSVDFSDLCLEAGILRGRIVLSNISGKKVSATVLLTYKGMTPKIGKNVFLAPGCYVIGDVEIGEGSSVWFNCVIRGDVAKIVIGKNTNIQDGTIIHGARFPNPTGVNIGDKVIIGHNVVIHACTIGNGSLIGMGALVLNRAVTGDGCLIGAGSIVTEDKVVPPGMMAIGSPARVIQEVTAEQRDRFAIVAGIYREEGIVYSELCEKQGCYSDR